VYEYGKLSSYNLLIIKKVEILFNNPGLRELNLGENKINHDGIIALTSVLNWNNDTLEVNQNLFSLLILQRF
jgi:hypothetical protein